MMVFCNVQLEVARDALSLYAGSSTEAIVALLMHKITRAAVAEGMTEARLLLRDWLVYLTIHAHRNLHPGATAAELAAIEVREGRTSQHG